MGSNQKSRTAQSNNSQEFDHMQFRELMTEFIYSRCSFIWCWLEVSRAGSWEWKMDRKWESKDRWEPTGVSWNLRGKLGWLSVSHHLKAFTCYLEPKPWLAQKLEELKEIVSSWNSCHPSCYLMQRRWTSRFETACLNYCSTRPQINFLCKHGGCFTFPFQIFLLKPILTGNQTEEEILESQIPV